MIRRTTFAVLAMLALCVCIAGCNSSSVNKKPSPVVEFRTTMGDIQIKLYPGDAPVSVSNFLSYVKRGFYNGTIFHRVIDGFMVQSGGFDANLRKKPTDPPIVNEANNGMRNYRGTVAYARANDINSATAQFFINLVDNAQLNYKNSTSAGFGYCVFGEVVSGMEVVDAIANVKTGEKNGMRDVPVAPIIILSSRIVSPGAEEGQAN